MIPRVHISTPLSKNSRLALSGDSANHLRALRVRPGDSIRLFDGLGGEYQGQVLALGKGGTSVQVDEFVSRECESPLAITLLQGISKGERMDFTIQKAVELGVASIMPVFTERSVVRLDGERLARRTRHWQSVAISACEQCGRNRIPSVLPASPLHVVLANLPDTAKLVLDPDAETVSTALDSPASLTLLVGPEGGLSDSEIRNAETKGFLRWSLGPRILRTETAGMAALAVLQYQHGDLGLNGQDVSPPKSGDATAPPTSQGRE